MKNKLLVVTINKCCRQLFQSQSITILYLTTRINGKHLRNIKKTLNIILPYNWCKLCHDVW